MTIADDIEQIKQQEQKLRFKSFAESGAWALGCQMQEMALKRHLPLVIDIRIGDRQLFFAALAGTTRDNSEWVRRKINSVLRFEKSSYRLNLETLGSGKRFDDSLGIDLKDYAAAGGGFPIHIAGTGVVGAITVSGIPQRQDHGFVVENLCRYLKHNHQKLKLESGQGD